MTGDQRAVAIAWPRLWNLRTSRAGLEGILFQTRCGYSTRRFSPFFFPCPPLSLSLSLSFLFSLYLYLSFSVSILLAPYTLHFTHSSRIRLVWLTSQLRCVPFHLGVRGGHRTLPGVSRRSLDCGRAAAASASAGGALGPWWKVRGVSPRSAARLTSR